MPLKENRVHCVNHPESSMHRADGQHVLCRVQADTSEVDASAGVRLRVYRCLHCGYMEFYEHRELA